MILMDAVLKKRAVENQNESQKWKVEHVLTTTEIHLHGESRCAIYCVNL
jgi:hypothetical protein